MYTEKGECLTDLWKDAMWLLVKTNFVINSYISSKNVGVNSSPMQILINLYLKDLFSF